MEKTKHTPGPWEVFRDGNSEDIAYIRLSEGKHFGENEIAVCYSTPNEANARLIAAAPELLEALERLMLILKDVNLPTAIESYAEAAIRKAKGESL